MAAPAAVLNILLTANTTQATAALAKTQAQLGATQKRAAATAAVVKKAMLGIGAAAAGAGYALYQIGEAFDDASDTIRTGTGATGKQLKRLEGDFKAVVKSVPADFDTASKAIAELNTRLGVSGKPLRRLTKQFTELSRITETDIEDNIASVTRAFGDWEVKTREQSDTLDYFFRAAQASGATVSDLAKQVVQFGAPLRQVGFELDEATAMFAQFEKAGVNTQTMMPGLRMALKNFLLEDVDPRKGLLKAFREIEDGTMKSSDALALFGQRAGADMVEAIKQGRFDLDEFTKSLNKNDETIRQAGEDTMDFAEHWQKFKNNIMLKLEPVAKRVFEKVGDAMKKVTDIISDPKLTSGEKLQRLTRLVMEAISNLATKVGEKAPMVAVEFVKGFFNAPILGRLVVGAWLLKRVGGAKAFQALGKMMGTKLGAGLVIGFALAGPDLVVQAYKLGRRIGDALDKAIPSVAEIVKGTMTTKVTPQELLKKGGSLDAVKQAFMDMGLSAREAGERTHDAWLRMVRSSNRGERDTSKSGRGVEKAMKGVGNTTDRETGRAKDATRDLARKGGKSFQNLSNAAAEGFRTIGKNVNNSLKALNVRKPVNFAIVNGKQVGTSGLQRGGIPELNKGAVVPGSAPGDRHTLALNGVPIAKVESGELISVANRKATAALMDVNERVPRFATGGMVGLKPGIARLAEFANKRFGLTVSSGFRPGDNDSFHGRGEAVDLVPPSMGATRGIFAAFKNQLAELFYDPWGGWDNGQMIGAIGDHMDHIHAAIAGGGSAVASMARLKKVLLSGPDGPLKDIGQSALDKVHKAARQFLSKQGGAGHGNIGAGALSEGQFLALARRAIAITSSSRAFGRFDPSTFSPSGLLTLAKAESSLIPSSINNWDSNAAAGNPSGGLMHLTQSNMRHYAEPGLGSNMFNPLASIAASINYQRDRYGHQVTHSPYKLGGVVAKLAEGGLLGRIADIKQKLKRKNLKPKEAEKLRDQLKKLRQQVKLQREQKKLKRERRKMAKRIKGRAQMEPWATHIEKATNTASILSEHLSDLQTVHGFTELPDVPDDEQLLGPNGQALLEAYNQAVNEELAELTKELQHALQLLSAQFTQRQTIIDALGVAGQRLVKMGGQKKGAEARLKKVNKRIRQIEAMPSNQREKHAKELRNLRNERGTLKTRITALKEAMGENGIRGFIGSQTDALNSLQGLGRDMLPVTDPFRESLRFGGEILGTRSNIDSIMKSIRDMKGQFISMPKAPAPQAMNIQGLLAFSEAIRLGAFKTEPFMGAFAKGGVALVGEQGPELAHLPSGTRIHTAQETRDMLQPNVTLNARIFIGNREITDIVRVEIDEADRDTANYARAL